MSTESTLRQHVREALKTLDQLDIRPKVDDWGTKVLFVYETLWEALEQDGLVHATQSDTLARLLDDPETLSLARLVIPELRDDKEAAKLTARPKLDFVQRIKALLEAGAPKDANAVDSAMYEAEKNAVYDADEYRAMLFLRQSGRFSEEESDSIREWLSRCPVKLPRDRGEDGP